MYTAMGALLLAMARFYPFDRFPLVTCPLRSWAHIPCPTCGMTRAFVRVMHGEWRAAFTVSPLGALLALFCAAAALYTLLRMTVLGRGFTLQLTPRESLVIRVGVVTVAIGNWAYLLLSGAAS